jgi:hypothetical protein
MTWAPDSAALELLERAGPFETKAYRSACAAALVGATDASFGASTDDGATAAVALIRQGRTVHLPYGYSGVRASRRLDAAEVRSFLHVARRAAGAQRLVVRDIFEAVRGGRVVGATSIAYLGEPPEVHFAKKARQSIRRAIRAGATCEMTADPAVFAGLYQQASVTWGITYPAGLIAAAAECGVAWFFDVTIDGRGVGSLAVLRGVTHWMYWLAAQNDVGRRAEVGYLAVAAMLEAARAAGAPSVNLGASAGLPGVAQFKQRLGGVASPVLEWRDSSTLIRLAGSSLATIPHRRRGRPRSAP